MLDSRKRPVAHSIEFWSSKRRKTSSPTDTTRRSPSPPPVAAGSVVALLALTDPGIVTRVMHFIPQSTDTKRGEATRVMGTLASLCRAMAPFDRDLPRHFGPQNQAFWQDMVLRYFDFSTRDTPRGASDESTAPRLAMWKRLGVSFVSSEYGFLHALQSPETDRAAHWPRKESAFTLFCDLALLVDKLSGLVAKAAPSDKSSPRFVPCLRRAGAIEAPVESLKKSTRTLPFESRVRRSRRQLFVQTITSQLRHWKHFCAYEVPSDRTSGRIDFYAGQSRRSDRWIGLTSVKVASQ